MRCKQFSQSLNNTIGTSPLLYDTDTEFIPVTSIKPTRWTESAGPDRKAWKIISGKSWFLTRSVMINTHTESIIETIKTFWKDHPPFTVKFNKIQLNEEWVRSSQNRQFQALTQKFYLNSSLHVWTNCKILSCCLYQHLNCDIYEWHWSYPKKGK